MKSKASLASLIVFLLFLASCEEKRPYTVLVSDNTTETISVGSLLDSTDNPPPESFNIISKEPGDDTPIDCTIEVRENSWRSQENVSRITAEAKMHEKTQAKTRLRKTVEETWYAPIAKLWEKPIRPTLEEVINGAVPVPPLDSINLPLRALPVSGIYPDDPHYPLVSRKILSVTFHTEREENNYIREWFADIPEDRTSGQRHTADIVWIGAVGDIMPGRGVDDILITQEDGLETVFRDTLPVLQSFDLLLGNLETVVSEGRVPIPKSYNFRVPPEVLKPLKEAGFDYFSLTNNHCYDYGEKGFLDTLRHLRENKIHTSGAGENRTEANRPYSSIVRGHHIAILSVGAYPREMNGFDGRTRATASDGKPGILWADDVVLDTLSSLSSEDRFTIVMAHGGKEWHSYPVPYQRELYRSFIDHGADLVLGSHPHVLQGMETYRTKLIAYSLGNFIFPGMEETTYGEESLILGIGIYRDRVLYVEPIPVEIDGKTVHIDSTGYISDRFYSLVQEMKTEKDISVP